MEKKVSFSLWIAQLSEKASVHAKIVGSADCRGTEETCSGTYVDTLEVGVPGDDLLSLRGGGEGQVLGEGGAEGDGRNTQRASRNNAITGFNVVFFGLRTNASHSANVLSLHAFLGRVGEGRDAKALSGGKHG